MDGRHHQPPPYGPGEGTYGTWIMGPPVPPHAHPANQQAATWDAVNHVLPHAGGNPSYPDYSAPYGGVHGYGYGYDGGSGGSSSFPTTPSPTPGNPYVQMTTAAGSSDKGPTDAIFKVLGRFGKPLQVGTRKAGSVAGNAWQHLKTGPSPTEAALARLSEGTKVFAEGGHDKIFEQLFDTFPGEKLLKSFACYLSTSLDPVMGTLYLSTEKLAFCSNNPLCVNSTPGNQDWRYYKVVLPLGQLKSVAPSSHKTNPAEKYIQTVTVDGQEFWFMGFMSYDKALKNITEALHRPSAPSYSQ